jgi:hypothetical protein
MVFGESKLVEGLNMPGVKGFFNYFSKMQPLLEGFLS